MAVLHERHKILDDFGRILGTGQASNPKTPVRDKAQVLVSPWGWPGAHGSAKSA